MIDMPKMRHLLGAALMCAAVDGFLTPLMPRALLARAPLSSPCRPPPSRHTRSVAARRSVLALRSQEQSQDTVGEDEGGRQGFPPPWLLPFLVPATGGALFGTYLYTLSEYDTCVGDS